MLQARLDSLRVRQIGMTVLVVMAGTRTIPLAQIIRPKAQTGLRGEQIFQVLGIIGCMRIFHSGAALARAYMQPRMQATRLRMPMAQVRLQGLTIIRRMNGSIWAFTSSIVVQVVR